MGITCIYFDHKQDYKPIDILRCLLKDMVLRKGTVSQEIHNLYRKHEVMGSTPPSHRETIEVFRNELNKFERFFCVIDGLDEASEDSRETVLQELQQFQPKLRLMVTGRPYVEDVPNLFGGCQILEIRAQDSDIGMFVEGQLKKDKVLRKKVATNAVLKKHVVGTIVEKAKGM